MDELCVYCGEPATDQDHVLPRVFRRMVEAVGMMYTRDLPDTVWACHECNLIAGANVFHTFEEKRTYIQRRLYAKYKDLLECSDWTDIDYSSCGYILRTYIKTQQVKVKALRRRLAYTALIYETEKAFLEAERYSAHLEYDSVLEAVESERETEEEIKYPTPLVKRSTVTSENRAERTLGDSFYVPNPPAPYVGISTTPVRQTEPEEKINYAEYEVGSLNVARDRLLEKEFFSEAKGPSALRASLRPITCKRHSLEAERIKRLLEE